MGRNVIKMIEKFELETDNTVRSFNKIFRGSPIVSRNQKSKVIIGELTINEFRNLYLDTGEVIENPMYYNYSRISPDVLTFAKYIYTIGNKSFSSLRSITEEFKGVTTMDITQSIEFNRPIKKHGGLLVEREITY